MTPEPDGDASRSATAARREWRPRFFEAGDEEGVVRLLQSVFGTWPNGEISARAEDHLRWKLSSHPHAPKLHIATEIDGEVVGWQGYWLQTMKVRDKELLTRQAVDFAVHRKFQGRGIKTRMGELAGDPLRRTFHFHFDVLSTHEALRLRPHSQGPFTPKLLANRVHAFVREAREGEGGQRRPAEAGRFQGSVRRTSSFDERIDAFWDEASRPFDLIVARRMAYLNWRYADARAGSYVILLAEQDDRVVGYAVLRLSFGSGYIVDLLALPGRIDAVSQLVAEGIQFLEGQGVSRVECWLPLHHPYQAVLSAFGFDRSRRTVSFLVRPADEYVSVIDTAFANDPQAAVHITMGDSDLG